MIPVPCSVVIATPGHSSSLQSSAVPSPIEYFLFMKIGLPKIMSTPTQPRKLHITSLPNGGLRSPLRHSLLTHFRRNSDPCFWPSRRDQSGSLHKAFPTLQHSCPVRQSLGQRRLLASPQFPDTLWLFQRAVRCAAPPPLAPWSGVARGPPVYGLSLDCTLQLHQWRNRDL